MGKKRGRAKESKDDEEYKPSQKELRKYQNSKKEEKKSWFDKCFDKIFDWVKKMNLNSKRTGYSF